MCYPSFVFVRSFLPTVTFATSCWERDWKKILLDPVYLSDQQIGYHRFPFSQKLLILNNIEDIEEAKRSARRKVEAAILTQVEWAVPQGEAILRFFGLKRTDFQPGPDAGFYVGVNPDWIYYNALAPLAAIYHCKTDYLLYTTGDVFLQKPVSWIEKAIRVMEKNPKVRVANLTWNGRYKEARRESYFSGLWFYRAKAGFSDQMFLVKTADFQKPIYGEIRADSAHFPRGDVFEKRVYSYMKNRAWERITYKWGSYIHL